MSKIKPTMHYDASSIHNAIKDLKNYEFRKVAKVGKVINKGLRTIARRARARAPVGFNSNRTAAGKINKIKLKNSIRMKMKDGTKGYAQASAYHAHLVEKGTKAYTIKRDKKAFRINDGNLGLLRFSSKKEIRIPARKGNPFFFGAAAEVLPGVERELKEVMVGV